MIVSVVVLIVLTEIVTETARPEVEAVVVTVVVLVVLLVLTEKVRIQDVCSVLTEMTRKMPTDRTRPCCPLLALLSFLRLP